MNKGPYPEPVVGAFIVNNQGKLFLMKARKWSDLWVIPGGHIEIGETIEQALKREIKEETNLKISNPKLICVLESINNKEFYEDRHMIFLNHRVEALTNDVKLNHEGQEYGWFGKNEVMKLPLNTYIRITLEKYSSKIFKF